MDEKKLERLKKLSKIVSEGLTKEEFTKSFEAAMSHILKVETELVKKINKIIHELEAEQRKFKGKTEVDLDKMKNQLLKDAEKIFNEQRNNLSFIQDKVKRIENGMDGKDGTDGKDGKPGKDGKDGVEGKSGKDYDPGDIEQLREDLKRTRLKGGGFSRIALKSAGGVTGTGTSHITVGDTEPTAGRDYIPATGDLWVDTS